MVTNLPHMEELHQLRGGGITGELSADLGERIRSSKTWAEWSPGLVAAIQESLRRWTALAKSSGGSVGVKKMDLESWKKHVLNQHQPFRRDCRRCMELMGRDSPHHRTSGDRASHVLTMDIVGPLPSGDDVGWAPGNGIPPKVKYMMVATVALPKLEREKGDQKDPEVEMDEAPEGDLFSRQAEAGEGEAEENQGGDQKAAEELNQKWLEHAKRLSEPVGVQPAELSAPCNMEINCHSVFGKSTGDGKTS